MNSTLEQIRETEPHSYGLECEYFLTNKDRFPLRIVECEELQGEEKSRIYGPFNADVLHWMMRLTKYNTLSATERAFTLSVDADGREYLEY